MVGDIIDVTDVVTTDIPEFDVVVAGDTGCFQKVEVFAEDDVSGVGTVDYKAPLRILGSSAGNCSISNS